MAIQRDIQRAPKWPGSVLTATTLIATVAPLLVQITALVLGHK